MGLGPRTRAETDFPILTVDASTPEDVAVEVAPPVDVKTEPKPACDPAKPFQAPVQLTGAFLSTGLEYAPSFSADELTMYFTSGRPYADGSITTQVHIYSATRPSIGASFDNPVPIDALNGPTNDSDPFLTPDGLTMYFQSDRNADPGDIFFATRPSVGSTFGAPQAITAVNTTDDDTQPIVDGSGALWFASSRATGTGNLDIYRAAPQTGSFGTPAEEVELDSPDDDWSPTITADALTIYFASKRTGGLGNDDIWIAKRTSSSLPFTAPQNVAELNSPEFELPHWLSADGCRIYLSKSNAATYALYVATKPQ